MARKKPASVMPRYFWAEVAYNHRQAVQKNTLSIRVRAATGERDRCHGSRYIWHFDTDYPCTGCGGCRNQDAPRAAESVGLFVFHVANAARHQETRDALLGIECLSRIGHAVEAALRPGWALQDLTTWATDAYNEIRKGRWYRVTGRQGNARDHFGAEGECTWVGEDDFGTARMSLRVPGLSRTYTTRDGVTKTTDPSRVSA